MNRNPLLPFKFSIIIAVYNVADFLEETMESLFQQDIGFSENVQVILVDDGSKDNSAQLCDQYQQQYPENILVIHKENGGVSSARNTGLAHVKGEYVNFLDGDDKLSKETLRIVYQYAQKWENIALLTIPLIFFDGKKGQHILNNKFEQGSRIIQVFEEYQYPLLSLSASFIAYEKAKDISLDTRLSIAEDAKAIMQILFDTHCYGVVSEGIYWYRRRTTGTSSAIQNALHNHSWYIEYLQHFSTWSLDESKKIFGYIPEFVQFTVMYDLQWRFQIDQLPSTLLSKEEMNSFQDMITYAVKHIEDTIILQQKSLFIEHKMAIFFRKYGTTPQATPSKTDVSYSYHDTIILRESQISVKLEFLKLEKDCLKLEGSVVLLNIQTEEPSFFLKVNEDILPCKNFSRHQSIRSIGAEIAHVIGFYCEIPFENQSNYQISVMSKIRNTFVEHRKLLFGKFFPLCSAMWNSYYVAAGHILTYDNQYLLISPYSHILHLHRELSYQKLLFKKKQPASLKAALLRLAYYGRKRLPLKKIWLISDRINKADDNGEMFFRYMCEHPDQNVRCIFAISKKCDDYRRMKQYGQVIPFGGWRYKWYYLCGAHIVSSQGEDYVYRPFCDGTRYYSDLIQKNKFVFLQHGVIKDDLSRWLNRYAKNIHLFVTTTIPEYTSVLTYQYFYNKQVVQLTGLPRHDYLYHDEKKYITIIPTWRSYLVSDIDQSSGERKPIPDFETSKYCQMYRQLLNHSRLIHTAKKYGYTIRFLSHPNMTSTVPLLKFDTSVEILSHKTPYRTVFAETNLLITDYSSVAFDYAYLRKPCLYYQADVDEFFSGAHTYDKGYFDYEQDGFGEVAYNVEFMVDKILEYIKNNCQLKAMYQRRIDQTFPFDDHFNCKRTYEAIKRL